MGWNAFSKTKNKQVFINAYNNVINMCGEDGYTSLKDGYIGKYCQPFLCEVFQQTISALYYKGIPIPNGVYSKGWSSEEVRQINKHADWNILCDDDDLVYLYSAKYFLRACALSGSAINFSY